MKHLIAAAAALLAASGADAAVVLSQPIAAQAPPAAASAPPAANRGEPGVAFDRDRDFSVLSASLAALATAAGLAFATLLIARRRGTGATAAPTVPAIAKRAVPASSPPVALYRPPAHDEALQTYGIFAERARTLQPDATATKAPAALPQWARFGGTSGESHPA